MKTLLLVNTGNDADIIGESLSHNEKFFDKILVIDRMSEDKTLDIIENLNNPKIEVFDMGPFKAKSSTVLNQAILAPYLEDYDFYTILDADEFIVADNLDELLNLPLSKVGAMPWKCYVPDDDVFSDVKKNITKRRTLEQESGQKLFIPSQLRCMLTLGNHHVVDYDKSIYNVDEYLSEIALQTIWIAHFPVRSREQYNRKIEFFNKIDRTGLEDRHIAQYRNISPINSIDELKDSAINYRGKIDGQEVIYDPVK